MKCVNCGKPNSSLAPYAPLADEKFCSEECAKDYLDYLNEAYDEYMMNFEEDK